MLKKTAEYHIDQKLDLDELLAEHLCKGCMGCRNIGDILVVDRSLEAAGGKSVSSLSSMAD